MLIHVIRAGETIQSIADAYGVSAERLIQENEINPKRLAIGETIIVQFSDIVYTIKEGDTLGSIADSHGVTVLQLLRNNSYLSDREYIFPGEKIVISYQGTKSFTLATNGYAYPFIDLAVLKKTLPFLTYITVFGYQVAADGSITDIDDSNILQMAKAYGVAPVMMLLAKAQTQEEAINVIHSILTNKQISDRFFDNLLHILNGKSYYAVSLNTPYIIPGDRHLYEAFVLDYTDRITKAGYKAFVTFSIRIFELLTGTIFSGLNYTIMGKVVNGFTLISYEFGYSIGVPPGTLSIETFRRFLTMVLKLIPAEKTQIGIRDIGYVWKLPYDPVTSKGMAISYDAAIELAVTNNAEIFFDETTNSAYFEYISGDEYVVRFWDARGINSYVKLAPELNLDGVGIWNIMSYFPQMWLVINSQYEIENVYTDK